MLKLEPSIREFPLLLLILPQYINLALNLKLLIKLRLLHQLALLHTLHIFHVLWLSIHMIKPLNLDRLLQIVKICWPFPYLVFSHL